MRPTEKAQLTQSLHKPKRKLASLGQERILPKEAGLGVEQDVTEGWGLLMAWSCQGALQGQGWDMSWSLFSSIHISKGKSHQKGT